jgi:hypothetical protein
MRTLILALVILSSTAQAQMVITPNGNLVMQQAGSTTHVVGSKNAPMPIAVPVTVNPVTGIGQVHTPQGSYLVQRSGSGTVTVIQTSRSK